ncbi:phage baseplate assembly protein V [Spartinivicinus marinus]|nr:phage baseplate assembly protein V [Spartinivicinus marinus]MCX4030355.1 phage baseplate assembly protein V [Spartinivicinus marinus]
MNNTTELNPPLSPSHYHGQVINTDDPKKCQRVQVQILGLTEGVPTDKLPWAEYLLPIGARYNAGSFTPVQVGDWVWVDFPYISHGQPDTRRPRIIGSAHFCPEGQPNTPHESWAGPESFNHQRTDEEPKPTAAQYHQSSVITQHGITVEYEPPGCYRVTHRATGTAFELNEQGVVLHSEQKALFSSKTNTKLIAGNQLTINVLAGDTILNVQSGNLSIKSAKNIIFEAGQNFIVKAKKFIEELG